MARYLASLERLLARAAGDAAPGARPGHRRRAREASRVSRTPPDARGPGPRGADASAATLGELLPAAYADTPRVLWPLAERSLLAHLDKLVAKVARGSMAVAGGDGRAGDAFGYSARAVALTFDGLAEVAMARDLLRRWWGLELGLTDAKGGGYDADVARDLRDASAASRGGVRDAS